ncbi:MAG: hypothetical protein ACE5Z5_12470 [Candidatus Bathyarchaeia archaeon]
MHSIEDRSGEEDIPLGDESLDLMLLIDVLYEIGDRGALFDEKLTEY